MNATTGDSGHKVPGRKKIADLYFLEHRAKLIDIAAFLDRYDRANDAAQESDFRVEELLEACKILTDGKNARAKRVLEFFSDFNEEIPQSANGMKSASGAVDKTGKNKQ